MGKVGLPTMSDEMQAFAQRVQDWRVGKGLTQEELSLSMGLHRYTVSRFERFHPHVFHHVFYGIANRYGVETLARLLGIPYTRMEQRKDDAALCRELADEFNENYHHREGGALHKAADMIEAPLKAAERRREMKAA